MVPFCIKSEYFQFYCPAGGTEFPNKNKLKRKESNSDFGYKNSKCSQLLNRYKKASLFASFSKGSLTAEAAVVIPVFVFAATVLIYLFEIMAVQTNIRAGMQYAGKKYAETAYTAFAVSKEQLKNDIIEEIGRERIERSIIRGGTDGITCRASYVDVWNQILYLKTEYILKIPMPAFLIPEIRREETIRIKGWSGYKSAVPVSEEQKIVYVTEHGMVYHVDYHCTYLDLSIRMVSMGELADLRNESGGKYYPCDKCGGKEPGWSVYITDTGNRYHTSLLCSGLKRKVYAVPISEAAGKGVCSKCGK